jgi:hypothetical protein
VTRRAATMGGRTDGATVAKTRTSGASSGPQLSRACARRPRRQPTRHWRLALQARASVLARAASPASNKAVTASSTCSRAARRAATGGADIDSFCFSGVVVSELPGPSLRLLTSLLHRASTKPGESALALSPRCSFSRDSGPSSHETSRDVTKRPSSPRPSTPGASTIFNAGFAERAGDLELRLRAVVSVCSKRGGAFCGARWSW